jgi:transcriptional regulator GlxA family with amidase domain
VGPVRVGVLAYPGCFASEVYGVPDLLVMAGHVAAAQGVERDGYEVRVVSPRQRVVAAGGQALDVRAVRPVDLLIVPGFELRPPLDLAARLAGLGPELAAISAQAAAGGALASICVGAFLLAEAGVLDGREATTSWLFADRLARRYPAVRVRPDQLVLTDGRVTTTAAFSAMYDYALQLIGARSGPQVARGTARLALVDDARTSQTPYVDPALLPDPAHAFSRSVQRHLDRTLSTPYHLPTLAAEFHTSTRTLLRRFRAETGRTPLAYLQSARIHRARHLLETTTLPITRIAATLGYTDPSTFSTLFTRHTGHRPSEYRTAFHRGGT